MGDTGLGAASTSSVVGETSPSTSTSPSKTYSVEIQDRIERNRRAAQEKRKLHSETPKECTSICQPILNSPTLPNPKRIKTGEEIQREEELRQVVSQGQVVRVQGHKLIDTGGGFLLDEQDLIEEQETPIVIVTEPEPIIENAPTCDLCQRQFSSSFLFHTYDHNVCDACRDTEGIHSYITRTDAKTEFLLKDEDFDKREPVLKFISKPNPHNVRWGDMKLYLRLQVEKRAIDIWGSLEKIETEREVREENRVKTKIKRYNKKMNTLRMSARSSLYTRDLTAHTHDWGDEVYLSDTDEYKHTCKDCGKSETYEKM